MESLSLSFSYQPGEYARALRRVQISNLRAVRDAVIAASLLGLAAFLWLFNGYSWVVGVMLVSIPFFCLLLGFGVFVVPVLVSRSFVSRITCGSQTRESIFGPPVSIRICPGLSTVRGAKTRTSSISFTDL